MRSTFTNQLIKSLLENNWNTLAIDDGGETHYCHSFKEACAVIDSVDDVQIVVSRRTDGYKYGWFYLTMCNDDAEQLVDHTNNDYCNNTVNRLCAKYDV